MKANPMKWLAVGLLVAAAGCGDKQGGVGRLNPRGIPYLEGVPVPSGFDLIRRDSTDYESGGQRNARHVYAGWADAAAVRSFYQEQMPLMGWQRVSGQNVEGSIALRFERKSEACNVEIRSTQILNRTTVQVTVSPFNRATQSPSEAPRRPVP